MIPTAAEAVIRAEMIRDSTPGQELDWKFWANELATDVLALAARLAQREADLADWKSRALTAELVSVEWAERCIKADATKADAMAEAARLRTALEQAREALQEINPANYNDEDVNDLNNGSIAAVLIIDEALRLSPTTMPAAHWPSPYLHVDDAMRQAIRKAPADGAKEEQ
jgi:hypothetical protein